jgi:ABC-type uncharacterized transport system involved in gliding motility auxiliary subunit
MKHVASYSGALGLGLLAAGLVLRVAQPERDRYWTACLVVGLSLVAVWVARNSSSLMALFGRRSTKRGLNALFVSLVVAGIVIAINYIASRHTKQWDLTAARQYTLSDQTRKLLSELERDVSIVLLDDPTSQQALIARDLLELYDNESQRLTVEVVDPEADPTRVLEYQNPAEPSITLGTVIVEVGDRRERATAATEPEITNALIRAQSQERKKIYFTGGHSEKSLEDTSPANGLSVIASRLAESTYDSETLVIARSAIEGEIRIPADADAVVVAGPTSDFLPEEIEALDRYLRGGGTAVVLVDPDNQGESGRLVELLAELGIVLDEGIVMDRYSLPPVSPVVRSYGRHPIVESFGNSMSLFPLVRSVTRAEEVPEGARIEGLFSTLDSESWVETRIEELETRGGPADDQTRGPIDLAIAMTLPVESGLAASGDPADETDPQRDDEGEEEESGPPSSRIVVVGDSDFIANDLASAPLVNADLFLNMVNWVVLDEQLISIRPREPEDRRIFLSPQQTSTVFLLAFLVIPGIVLVTGISVWWGRR